ncbi:MAG: NAD(P)/FAD-dependent oxidoreductase [Nitrososphaerales archaeon]
MEQKTEVASKQLSENARRVVILGGGFAGLTAAKTLCAKLSAYLKVHGRIEVLLINKWNYHLFTPLLYQASTGLVDIDSIAQPIRPEARKSHFEFLEAEVRSINVQAQVVYAGDRSIPYDYLVIALGTIKDDTKVEGATKYAIPLKTLDDGSRIHDRIIESFERAANLPNGPERGEYLNFVVIGGSTGAELAGSVMDYVRAVAKDYPGIDVRRDCRVYIIEAGERLFPDSDKSLSYVVKQSLEERGVAVLLKTRVEKIDHTKLTLSSGETIESWNIFDNTGVKPNSVLETISEDIVKKKEGKIVVNSSLRIPDFESVFAIGDNASVVVGRRSDGKPRYAPPTAESAVEEGKYVGRLIARELNTSLGRNNNQGASPKPLPVLAFNFKEKGTMLSIGAHNGIAKFPKFTFTGFLGWLIWRIVHLYLIATARAKLTVAFDWVLDAFGNRNTSQLGKF